MKNKIQSFVGSRLEGRKGNTQRTSNLSPTNHQRYHRTWGAIFTLVMLFTFAIGNVMAADFTATQIVASGGASSGNVTVSSNKTGTVSAKVKNVSGVACAKIETSDADWIRIEAASGYKLSSPIVVTCASNSDGSTATMACVLYDADGAKEIKLITAPARNSTTEDKANITFTANYTKIELYKRVKATDPVAPSTTYTIGSGTNYPSSTTTFYVASVSATAVSTSGGEQAAPTITNPATTPDLAEITAGETKQFSVTATGNPTPSYKWYSCDDAEKTNPTEISGAATASYTTSNSLAVGTYYYYCVATNSKGSATSPVFSLKVNELGGDLTAHIPGLYEKAADKGGYGQTLVTKTVDSKERQYEIYGLVKSSDDAWWFAGTKSSNTSDAHCISSAKFNASTPFTPSMIKGAWMKGSITGTASNMSSAKDEFPAISSYGPIKLNSTANSVMIKVQGYDQISFYAKDKNSTASNNKHLVVKINGVEQSMTLNTSYSVRRFTLTPSAVSVIEISGSTVADENDLAAFSLRIPEIPSADKFTVGVEDNSPCVASGESATITLSGSQSGVSYQLYKDAVAVEGKVVAGTGDVISFSGIEVAGTYTVKSVANASYKETAMNGSAAVTLAESPVITTQPTASQKVAVSSAVELSVVTSTTGVSYQWYSTTDPANPAVEIDGATNATLNITSAATATTMYYYCLISKSGMCSLASDFAEVITKTGCETETLATSTNINNSSDTHTGCTTTINLSGQKLGDGKYYEMSLNGGFKAGDIVTVNVKANDYESGKLYMVYGTHSSYSGYQVQNGPTEGDTDDVEFIIPSDMNTIGFLRTTTTTDGNKTQNHEIKSVTVERETCYCVKPTIGTQPTAAAICTGSTATLTVGNITGGATPYTYAWYNGDGTAVSGGSGATTASYTTAALAANASYYCVVSTADGCSAQSNTAAITIKPATTITTQPVDAEASVNIAQEFSVVATGAGTLTYQWQIQEGENWTDIANADEATYSVSKAAAGDYKFRCVVSGDCGNATSNVVTLSVSASVLTITYNANGGSCETPSATWKEGDPALVLPTATKTNWDFIGWYDAATGGNKIASPYTPGASIELFAHYMPKLVQAIYSNTFDAFIKNQAVTVYYLQGESAPTLSSIKVLGQESPVYEEVDGNIKVTVAEVDYIFPVTKTAVAPYAGTGEKETFNGGEAEQAYIKTGYAYNSGWRFSKTDDDWSRETPGNTRVYFFLGAAEQFTLESTGTARAMKVYRNGVELTVPTSSGDDPTIAGTNTPAMYAIVSNQTKGDGKFTAITIKPWVSVTSVTLKEGTTAISSKEIAQGAQFTLTAVVAPTEASNPTIIWESENASIASVANGVVTGEATGGPVNIIARSQDDNSIYAACAVTVAAPCTPATVAWDVEPTDGVKGSNGSASVTTNYAAGLEVVSSDPTVVAVSNDGVNITINYLKKGSAKITATVVGDGSIYCNTPASVEKTITVSPDCPVSGNLFAWAIDPEANNVVYNVSKNSDEVEVVTTEDVVTVTGGNVYLGTTASNSTFPITSGAIKIRENGNNYIKVVLECALQAGDVLSYTSDNSDNRYMSIKKNNEGTAVTTSTDGKHKYVLDSESPLIGAEVLYMTGSNSDNSFKTLRIDRLAPVTGVSLANATVAIGNTVTPTMTLLPSNEAYYESIAWSIVGEGEGTIANINATTGVVTALAAGTVTVQVKLNNSESLKATCQVEVVASFEQVDVTETTTWDMTNVSANHIELTGDDKNARLLLANIDGVNNTTFNAQALKFEGQHIGRTESDGVKHLAGRYVQFNVTVPGAVFVTFASNGNNARTIAINDKKCARTTSGTAADKYITYALAVEPGSVEIIGYEGESANQYVRISKIEFKAEYSYHRENLNPANIGTLCWTNDAILGGATLYKLTGKNENNYLVFDEVEENRLVAGEPYIFVPENGNTEIKVYNTDTEAALTTPVQNTKGMQGTFDELSSADGTTLWGNYVISKNHYIFVNSDNVILGANRAYVIGLDNLDVVSSAPTPGTNGAPRRRLVMGGNAPAVATDVDNIYGNDTKVQKILINGQLFIIRGDKTYDATGRLVK